MRHTIRGIIIRDRKVLLVTGHKADFYWTPGGGVEAGETIEETLRREILEELGVTITSLTPYNSYEDDDQEVDNFYKRKSPERGFLFFQTVSPSRGG